VFQLPQHSHYKLSKTATICTEDRTASQFTWIASTPTSIIPNIFYHMSLC